MALGLTRPRSVATSEGRPPHWITYVSLVGKSGLQSLRSSSGVTCCGMLLPFSFRLCGSVCAAARAGRCARRLVSRRDLRFCCNICSVSNALRRESGREMMAGQALGASRPIGTWHVMQRRMPG